MFYNKGKSRIKQSTDCICCEFFDKKKKKCQGFGKNCFEYDQILQVAIDPITKLPLKFEE